MADGISGGMRRSARALAAVTALALCACSSSALDPEVAVSASPPPSVSSSRPSGPSASTASPAVTTTATPAATPSRPSLVGDTRNAWAFAPIADPEQLVVEGSVPSQRAWSTSKVLVAAAYLEAVVDGDPSGLDAEQRQWIARALGESHWDSLLALRRGIGGDGGARMTAILRSIGDEVTAAPARNEGAMQWSVAEQVRFMAALARGEVVSPATSAYLLEAMQPVASQRWGLGSVDADAVKGGWLTSTTETRQMGLLDGYAVAIITDAVGPAVPQSDGDDAHVEQLDLLAQALADRLAR